MPRNNIYYVYDHDVLIDEGTSGELANKYHISKMNFANYVKRGNKLYGLYDIRLSGLQKGTEKKEKPKPIMSAYEKTLNYLYRHLAKYGNTVLNEKDDPFQYIPELEKMLGEKVSTRRALEKDDFWNYQEDMSQPGKYKRGRANYFYVLEVL